MLPFVVHTGNRWEIGTMNSIGTKDRVARGVRVRRDGTRAGGVPLSIGLAAIAWLGTSLGSAVAAESPFAPVADESATTITASDAMADLTSDAASGTALARERGHDRARLPERKAERASDEGGLLQSYHGELVDARTRAVEPTPALVERTQNALLERIAAAFGEEREEQYEMLRTALFEADALEPLDRPRIKSRLIEIWLDELGGNERELDGDVRSWRASHDALRLNLPRAFDLQEDREGRLKVMNTLSPTAREALVQFARSYRWKWLEPLEQVVYEVIPRDWYFPLETPYIDDCRAAGVPIPPGWGEPGWQHQGVLNEEFIDARDIATVYAYQSTEPEGSCIALPRTDEMTGEAKVFGIICLGIETENACFWDKYDTPSDELTGRIPLTEWISGSDFSYAAGDCSSCHAGENPFVIHPGTALDIGAQGFPIKVDWHNPMLPPDWAGNPGPISLPADTSYLPEAQFPSWLRNVLPENFSCSSARQVPWFLGGIVERLCDTVQPGKSCTGCHELPDVTHEMLHSSAFVSSYCRSVLSDAARQTMPPVSFDPTGHPAGWAADTTGDYQVHIEALNDLCN